MSRYQHTKGQIRDNAIEALLHDPLFRQRVEKNKKGKGSYMRKGKHGNRGNWEASGKKVNHFFTTGLLLSLQADVHHVNQRKLPVVQPEWLPHDESPLQDRLCRWFPFR